MKEQGSLILRSLLIYSERKSWVKRFYSLFIEMHIFRLRKFSCLKWLTVVRLQSRNVGRHCVCLNFLTSPVIWFFVKFDLTEAVENKTLGIFSESWEIQLPGLTCSTSVKRKKPLGTCQKIFLLSTFNTAIDSCKNDSKCYLKHIFKVLK